MGLYILTIKEAAMPNLEPVTETGGFTAKPCICPHCQASWFQRVETPRRCPRCFRSLTLTESAPQAMRRCLNCNASYPFRKVDAPRCPRCHMAWDGSKGTPGRPPSPMLMAMRALMPGQWIQVSINPPSDGNGGISAELDDSGSVRSATWREAARHARALGYAIQAYHGLEWMRVQRLQGRMPPGMTPKMASVGIVLSGEDGQG